MKYSVNFSNHFSLSAFDEIIIKYDKQDASLLNFLEEHSKQRIILSIDNIYDFDDSHCEQLNHIYERYPYFAVRLLSICSFDLVSPEMQHIKEQLTMPCFFGYVVTTFDELQHILAFEVSDVYLAEDICFDLVRAKSLCRAHNTAVRAFPNVAQASVATSPALTKFFIRPEDVVIYDNVIDILEFWGPLEKQAVLYLIYSHGQWAGDLQSLILDLNFSFDSRAIVNDFAKKRKTCRRKCMRGDECTLCKDVYDFSQKLAEQNLQITH